LKNFQAKYWGIFKYYHCINQKRRFARLNFGQEFRSVFIKTGGLETAAPENHNTRFFASGGADSDPRSSWVMRIPIRIS